MLTKDLLLKYHKLIPFPWTLRKIKKAGITPSELFFRLDQELEGCEDANSETAKAAIELIKKLEMIL